MVREMATKRIARRTLLKGAAAGAAALGLRLSVPDASRAVAAADAVQLNFWNPATTPVTGSLIATMVDTFNSTVGKEKGIFVNNIVKDNEPDYVPYTTAMTSSGSPDVVMTFAYDPVVAWAANGFLTPIDDYVAALGIKKEDYFDAIWQMTNFAGHTWGLLQEFDFNQLCWNTDIHAGAPPKTFDELDKLIEQYTTSDGSGNLTQIGLIPWSHSASWNVLWGGSYYNIPEQKWTINTPENLRYLDWCAKWAKRLGRDKTDALESSIPREYGDIFQYGKTAFELEGEYFPGNLTKQGIKLNYKAGHPPTTSGVPYGTAQTGGGNVLCLPSKSGHPEEAAAFINYMGGHDAVLAWCIPSGNMPPIKAAADDPAFTKPWPILEPWLDSMRKELLVAPNPSPVFPNFNDLIGTAIDEITYKGRSTTDALADVESGVAKAVTDFQQSHPDWKGE